MNESASDQYIRLHAQCEDQLDRIRAALSDMPHPDGEKIHYGHVGDVQRILEQLQEIANTEEP